MGDYAMKLTNDSLKQLILEVMSEATQETEYKRIMNMLQGGVESVDQMAILTPENPKAEPLTPKQNAARAEEFEKELAAAGYGFRTVSGMYEGPEDSYLVPHMTLEDAKRFAYKYGQESFIHSSRDGEGMKHSLEYPDYGAETADPSYDEETYGKILEVPPQVQIASSTPADSVLGHADMAAASDYYSHVPDKKWDEKVKDGKLRPAGEKAGNRFSIDFDFDKSATTGYDPEDDLRDPRYVREAKYIFINKADVPNTMEARKLVENIQALSKQVTESNRLGSSRYYARMRLRGFKKQLQEMIKGQK
jgi:hypothetical protein